MYIVMWHGMHMVMWYGMYIGMWHQACHACGTSEPKPGLEKTLADVGVVGCTRSQPVW